MVKYKLVPYERAYRIQKNNTFTIELFTLDLEILKHIREG